MSKLLQPVAEEILNEGGRIALANSGWWDLDEVNEFESKHCLRRVYFHGCMLDVKGKEHPGPYHRVTKESLKSLASSDATSHMSMSQQKVAKPNKQVSTLLLLHKLVLKVGIQRKHSVMYHVCRMSFPHLSPRTFLKASGNPMNQPSRLSKRRPKG